MTKHSLTTVYKKNMAFSANIKGHEITMDVTPDGGGDDTGPSPKRLILASLAGCTGMDVVSLLNKMKAPFSDFSIDIDADINEDYPKIYDHVKITYKIKIAEADRRKMEKAIKLSQEKYCSVSAMFRAFAKMDTVF